MIILMRAKFVSKVDCALTCFTYLIACIPNQNRTMSGLFMFYKVNYQIRNCSLSCTNAWNKNHFKYQTIVQITNLSSATLLSLVKNVDFHPRPIGDDGSSSSPNTRVYNNPCSSSRSTNSGCLSFTFS